MKLQLLSQETGIIIIRAGISLKTGICQAQLEAFYARINYLTFTTTLGGRHTIIPVLQTRKQRLEREAGLRITYRTRTLRPKASPATQESEDSENLINGDGKDRAGVPRGLVFNRGRRIWA